MKTPTRLLRATATEIPGLRPILSPRELDRKNLILKAGRKLFAQHGRHTMSLAAFAQAIWVSPATIRRLFLDLDCLLSDIILDHLQAISRALGDVPADAPDRPAARRTAYFAVTRNPGGSFTDAHTLLVRDRHHLPADLLAPIQQVYDDIAADLCPGHAIVAISLLDNPALHPEQIEAEFAPRRPAPVPKPQIVHQAPGPVVRPNARPHDAAWPEPRRARAGPP